MSDYHNVWGAAQRQWCTVDPGDHTILNVLTVFAWSGMAFSFIFGLFAAVVRSDVAAVAMLVCLAIWLTCGIAAIRIRRGRRKFLRFQSPP
jgi:hypothetical protein